MTEPRRPRLLIIGTGWAGLYIAQYINTSLYSVSIVSPRRMSAYTPLLASAACGIFPFSCAEESIRVKGRDCEFYKAFASTIDFVNRRVHCVAAFDDGNAIHVPNRNFDLTYDKLVIAPGCQSNTFGIQGVAEHALFMKHVSDAMTLRKRLFDQFEKASLPTTSRENIRALLYVTIVGGGPTGVEITAELSDLGRKELIDLYPTIAQLFSITIYDVASHILGSYDTSLYQYATERMTQQGINVETQCIIEKVENGYLHVNGRDPIPFGILLWVTGNKSVSLVDSLEVKKSEKGLVRILTDKRLHVQRLKDGLRPDPNVYALGDAPDIEEASLPTTAEVAVQKAKYLVHHLNTSDGGDTKPFFFVDKRLVTYLGNYDGIREGRQVDEPWSGQRAWLGWRSGSFTWTRTWRNWILIALAMFLNALLGKDITRL